ncbi:SAM-dependent methyltransferase [Terribacillus saccharophilus]|uniref:SAM-dependent methyltransferase n=1 Tax=Terribacillus saccharophilus TaxID=361277 RepID=A0A268HBI6_9BACI|nr:class I SAM-dependent methyltransferase [Terribacillus saccharophilus]PAE07218.1 SAM-dependent methyltransferase [Terribacillus saccharophilus]
MKQNIYDNEVFFENYKALREDPVNYNELLEQPEIKRMLPDLNGKHVLDIGCGMGDLARYCAEHGAERVTAIDPSSKMLQEAKDRNGHPAIEFVQTALEDAVLKKESYDIAVSSLVMHYVADYDAVIQSIHASLKEDGILLFSTEHPIVTARKEGDKWITDEEGNRLHFAVDNYQEQGRREQKWYVNGVVYYHRSFAALCNGLIRNGFSLQEVTEPMPSEAAIAQLPRIDHELRRPSFIILKARKTARP